MGSMKCSVWVLVLYPVASTFAQYNTLLPFNWTSKRLKGNQSQWSLKVGHIHVNTQNRSCQIMFVLCLIHFVSTLPFMSYCCIDQYLVSLFLSVAFSYWTFVNLCNKVEICIRNKITNWVDASCVPQIVDIYGFVKSQTKKVESFCQVQTNIDGVVWERGYSGNIFLWNLFDFKSRISTRGDYSIFSSKIILILLKSSGNNDAHFIQNQTRSR